MGTYTYTYTYMPTDHNINHICLLLINSKTFSIHVILYIYSIHIFIYSIHKYIYMGSKLK